MERLAGVTVEAVDRTKNEARVRLEGMTTSVDRMIEAIQGAGRFHAIVATG